MQSAAGAGLADLSPLAQVGVQRVSRSILNPPLVAPSASQPPQVSVSPLLACTLPLPALPCVFSLPACLPHLPASLLPCPTGVPWLQPGARQGGLRQPEGGRGRVSRASQAVPSVRGLLPAPGLHRAGAGRHQGKHLLAALAPAAPAWRCPRASCQLTVGAGIPAASQPCPALPLPTQVYGQGVGMLTGQHSNPAPTSHHPSAGGAELGGAGRGEPSLPQRRAGAAGGAISREAGLPQCQAGK